MTNADLLREARRAYEHGVIDDFGGGASKDDVIAFVPQLVDALALADKGILKSCPWCFKNLDDDTPSRQISHLVDCGDRHRDEAQAYHARVRKWAIQPWQRAMTAGKWWSCRKCGAGWEGSIERHKSDCFATPLATATVEQGEAT